MPKGKMATQVAHASVDAVLKSDKMIIDLWQNEGSKKAVLKVNDKKELGQYINLAKKNNVVSSVIKDAAKTFFKIPQVTCLAIGPDKEEKIDKITGDLSLM